MSKVTYMSNAIFKNSKHIFHRTRKILLKVVGTARLKIAKTKPRGKKKSKAVGIILPNFIYKATITEIVWYWSRSMHKIQASPRSKTKHL